MTIIGKIGLLPPGERKRFKDISRHSNGFRARQLIGERDTVSAAHEPVPTGGSGGTAAHEEVLDLNGEPRIAYMRWLAGHPGRKPSDFEPIIKEAEFAFRCRAAFVPVCDDLGGSAVMERQLRNLELGLCCGWRVLEPAEARSLADWLDAVLPHHPWAAAKDWRQSEAQDALVRHGRTEVPSRDDNSAGRSIADAKFGDVFDQACAFSTWQDVQAVVLGAWLGGALLVDERGYLIEGWKKIFAETLASRIQSLP